MDKWLNQKAHKINKLLKQLKVMDKWWKQLAESNGKSGIPLHMNESNTQSVALVANSLNGLNAS